jgi:Rad3-related DNA helicase
MSKSQIDSNLPKVAEFIKFLLDQHKADKGIIHAGSYKIAQFVSQYLQSNRILIHESHDREQVYLQHLASNKPTVLLSPSMTEGVDLADDASRFQIICKIPYPYLGDEVIKRRMQKDPKWYDFQTAKTIIQALGRSIRNEKDYAISYILDSDWNRFFIRNKHLFPVEIVGAIKQE